MGAIVAACSTYGTFQLDSSWSWKIPSLLQGLVSLFQAIFIFWVPESPRWLIANGRTEEATRFLCKYHSGSEEPTELVRLQVAEITCAIDFERSFESSSYLQFFRTSESHALLPHNAISANALLTLPTPSQRAIVIDYSSPQAWAS